jgi:hypothetical protein
VAAVKNKAAAVVIDKDAVVIDEDKAEKNSTTTDQDKRRRSEAVEHLSKIKCKEREVGFKPTSHSKIEAENLQVINVRKHSVFNL